MCVRVCQQDCGCGCASSLGSRLSLATVNEIRVRVTWEEAFDEICSEGDRRGLGKKVVLCVCGGDGIRWLWGNRERQAEENTEKNCQKRKWKRVRRERQK